MTRLLLLLALLFASGSAAMAQDGSLFIRFDESQMDDGGLSLAGVVRGLHVVTTWDDMEPQQIVLFSALVSDGEVVARGRAPFLAMAIDDELPEGITLRDSRLDLGGEYAERRAETPMLKQILAPLAEGEEIPGGDQFFPGDLFIPGGDQFLPGDQFFPGDLFNELAEAPLAFPGDLFVGGRAGVDARRGLRDREVLRATERAHPEAFGSGETLIVFFAAHPEGGSESDIAILRKRPSR